MRVAVYTSIVGNYDSLKEPKKKNKDFDYYCISDDKSIVKGTSWKFLPSLQSENKMDDARHNRFHKIFPHLYFPRYDISLYVDGSVLLKNDLSTLVKKGFKDRKIAFAKHPIRRCIYEEGNYCIKNGIANTKPITSQLERYSRESYPKRLGLINGSMILRKHMDKDIIKLMEDWWIEICRGSPRDQLSFNYIAWKNRVSINYIPDTLVKRARSVESHK